MQLGNFYWCILSLTCFGYIRPSSGALDVELQHMVFCTEFFDGWWSWEPLCRSCVRCGWCRARHEICRAKNTSIKLPSCIPLFHEKDARSNNHQEERKITDSELNSCKLAPVLVCSCIHLRECNYWCVPVVPKYLDCLVFKEFVIFPSSCRVGMNVYIYSPSSAFFIPTSS